MHIPALPSEGALEADHELSLPVGPVAECLADVIVVARVAELEYALAHYLHLGNSQK